MRKSVVLLIIVFIAMPFYLFGQSYNALWKKVKEAEDKDLPKTQYEVLQTIVDKAAKAKDYGQLLKAELQGAKVMGSIAPDSLRPALERMKTRCEAATDPVLKIVYQTALYRICSDNPSLEMTAEKPVLDETVCQQLARIKDDSYSPFVKTGNDSQLFNHDLLSVVGYELRDYTTLHTYYNIKGNRKAACMTAIKAYEYDSKKLDSLIGVYGDMEEAGEIAIAYYHAASLTVEEKVQFIHRALDKWGNWKRMNELRNELQALTNPQFQVNYDRKVSCPNQPLKIKFNDVRNLSKLTVNIYRVKADGDTDLRPDTEKGYAKLKPLLTLLPVMTEKPLTAHQPYEFFEDSLTLEGLPVGVYMLEFTSNPSTEVVRQLFFVTDVYTMVESQPNGMTRFVVVSATTGQPIARARLRLRQYPYSRAAQPTIKTCTVNAQGEYLFKNEKKLRTDVFAYTDNDKASPEINSTNQYRYYTNNNTVQQTQLYTDRSIYRPGQTVHVAALVYDVADGYKHSATANKQIRFTLRDANYKQIEERTVKTDEYGVCTTDFTLPKSALTGRFTIQGDGASQIVRVEEYKRPSFQVEFEEVKQHYEAGDTVRVQGTARSYAGVPVQGATVTYTIERRMAFWWWNYWRYYDTGALIIDNNSTEVYVGQAQTDDEGHFYVDMPLTMPDSAHPLFFNFVATADVTDTAGETHSGSVSLPLGNRKTALSIDIEEQILAESSSTMVFHLRNAAGKDIDADVRYRIDEGKWLSAKTTQHLSLSTYHLKSGQHTVEATCQGDTLIRRFVIFSINDQRPATETAEWFWQSASQFPNDGTPVTVQVGSTDKDMHIVYSIFSGDKMIESGAIEKSNALINRQFTYQEEWGNGILLNFAWVKNGVCHSQAMHIQRPLPDKQLKLEWTTFRDRLTPGQQEEWTLTVTGPDGKPAQASLMGTLYDMSLDQLYRHDWHFSPYVWLPMPDTRWQFPAHYTISRVARKGWSQQTVKQLAWSHFDESLFSMWYGRQSMRGFGSTRVYKSAMALESAPIVGALNDAAMDDSGEVMKAREVISEKQSSIETPEEKFEDSLVQIRENLNETAFFYPQLTTDAEGKIALKFTLPESLTTWRFMGLAHTKDMCHGKLTGEAIAQKEVMIQPNMPRFVREGDQTMLTARIFNISEKSVEGTALLRLIDPDTEEIVFEQREQFSATAGSTVTVSFQLATSNFHQSLLICQVTASGKGFSDGEQQYLPILPATERMTVTVPFTQNEPGTKTIDLKVLIPEDGTNGKLTMEYTNNPAWLMIQGLPTIGKSIDDNVISQTAVYYANSIGQHIINQNPKAKSVFERWQMEDGTETSLTSALEKNQELKDIILGETPWVMDAERESEQKQRLADFFDTNLMQNRLKGSLSKIQKLQRTDGSWSWWPDMPGSFYMTVAVSEMLVRLNSLTGKKSETSAMLDRAFTYMGDEIVEMVKEMKKEEKKGHRQVFPSFKTLQWLCLCTLDGRALPTQVQAANDYLLPLLKKDIKGQSIYEKALTAVILSQTDKPRALEYVKSLKEFTVYREEMGRYYDTPRAGYSWYDYKIPTQTMAIEALQRLTPSDQKTIIEMQRWLLLSKRTQAWDTPINSVNAVYAFLGNQMLTTDDPKACITIDAKPLQLPEAKAAIGYIKTPIDAQSKTLTIEKTSEGTSWGAVYAQFTQPTKSIANQSAGLKIKREILGNNRLTVGERITVRLTIEADRDYDFVQVIDKRAACMEPVRQLSGYHSGSYCVPRDYSTNYYFDLLSKGKHVIENEFYIDRAGTYETGTCTVQCAYAPEFHATSKSQTIEVKNKK